MDQRIPDPSSCHCPEPRVVCWRPHLAGTRQYISCLSLHGLLKELTLTFHGNFCRTIPLEILRGRRGKCRRPLTTYFDCFADPPHTYFIFIMDPSLHVFIFGLPSVRPLRISNGIALISSEFSLKCNLVSLFWLFMREVGIHIRERKYLYEYTPYWSVSLWFVPQMNMDTTGWRYAKRSLMPWVVVIPKEGRACITLLLVWHRLFQKKKFFLQKNLNSRCHTKRRAGAAPRARPSFGMTTTQGIRDLLV